MNKLKSWYRVVQQILWTAFFEGVFWQGPEGLQEDQSHSSKKNLRDTPKCSFSPFRTKLCFLLEVCQYVWIHQHTDQKEEEKIRWIFWRVLVVIDMVFMPILCAQLSLQRFLLQFGDITWNWVYCSLELHANKMVHKKPNA